MLFKDRQGFLGLGAIDVVDVPVSGTLVGQISTIRTCRLGQKTLESPAFPAVIHLSLLSEIAQMTGRPVGTVTKQLSRAIQRLRRWACRQEDSR